MNISELIFSRPAGIVLYLDAISLIAVAVTVYDKKQAHTRGRCVPEKNLFTLAIFGGSPAMLVTMHVIRHEAQHKYFMLGLPLITPVQLIIASLMYQFTR